MSENTLKPCPFCGCSPVGSDAVGSPGWNCRMRDCPASFKAVSREIWNTRPTPSSALTKALGEVVKRAKPYFREGFGYFASDTAKHLAEPAIEALRASPGGEAGIEKPEATVKSDENPWSRGFLSQADEIEQAEIRGAEWALEKAKDSCYILVDTDNFEPQRSISGWPSAAAIVVSHRSKP